MHQMKSRSLSLRYCTVDVNPHVTAAFLLKRG